MRCVMAIAGLLLLLHAAKAQEVPEPAPLSRWAEQIENYARELSRLKVEQYRDKKDFGWILTEYEKQSAGDYEPLKTIAGDLLTRHRGDAIFEWRLHRLLAAIAQKQGNKESQAKSLESAITSYPAEITGEPSKHSSLQHLYNERALLMIETDAKPAEDYILKSFRDDKRFVYFYSPAWKLWYEQHDQVRRYQPLMQKVQTIYAEKASADAEHRELLKRYAQQHQQESSLP